MMIKVKARSLSRPLRLSIAVVAVGCLLAILCWLGGNGLSAGMGAVVGMVFGVIGQYLLFGWAKK